MNDIDKDSIMLLLDKNLKNSFKAQCAQQGVTMTEVLMKSIENFVNNKQRRRA